MDRPEFLLKLLLLGFECQPKALGVDAQYRYKHLCVQFYSLRTNAEIVRLHDRNAVAVTALTINHKYEVIYNQVLKTLGITDDHVQGKLKKEDSS